MPPGFHKLHTGDPIVDSLAELSSAVNGIHEHLGDQDLRQSRFETQVGERLDSLDQKVAACIPRPILAVLFAQGKAVLTFLIVLTGGGLGTLTL